MLKQEERVTITGRTFNELQAWLYVKKDEVSYAGPEYNMYTSLLLLSAQIEEHEVTFTLEEAVAILVTQAVHDYAHFSNSTMSHEGEGDSYQERCETACASFLLEAIGVVPIVTMRQTFEALKTLTLLSGAATNRNGYTDAIHRSWRLVSMKDDRAQGLIRVKPDTAQKYPNVLRERLLSDVLVNFAAQGEYRDLYQYYEAAFDTMRILCGNMRMTSTFCDQF